jgi:hypothetical protein
VYWVRFPVRAVPVARKRSTIEERRQDQSCLFERWDYRNEGRKPPKLSWVRFPVKMVSVDRKLITIEERRKDQNCLFRRGNYRNKTKNSWVRFPMKMVPVARKLSTIVERRQDQRPKLFVSARRLQELRPQSRKLSWIRVRVKILGLGILSSYDFQRYVSNDQAYGKLSGNNWHNT